MFFKLISPSIKFSFSLPLPLPLRSRHTGELCFNFSQNVRCVRELLRGFYLAEPQTVLNLNLFYRRMSVESSPKKKKKSSLKSTVVFGSRRQSFLDHWIILGGFTVPAPTPASRSRSRFHPGAAPALGPPDTRNTFMKSTTNQKTGVKEQAVGPPLLEAIISADATVLLPAPDLDPPTTVQQLLKAILLSTSDQKKHHTHH